MSRCNPWTSPVQPRGLTLQASLPHQASLTSGASRTAATMCSSRGPGEAGRSLKRSSKPRTFPRERKGQPGNASSQSSSKIPKVSFHHHSLGPLLIYDCVPLTCQDRAAWQTSRQKIRFFHKFTLLFLSPIYSNFNFMRNI